MFNVFIFLASLIAGAVASIAGFGIGSILTPLIALKAGTKLAVAMVSIAHFFGTALRFWILRSKINLRLLWWFGISSAIFGLAGAVIQTYTSSRILSILFGVLLVAAGISTLTGLMEKLHPGKKTAWVAGGISGILGGMVGNQGGIRTAALLGFHVKRDAFVATATAIALMVDAGRVPVYLITEWNDLARNWPVIVLASLGVIAGTIAGGRLLKKIPEKIFHRVVAVIIIILGIYMIIK